jgi:hypothetical protein
MLADVLASLLSTSAHQSLRGGTIDRLQHLMSDAYEKSMHSGLPIECLDGASPVWFDGVRRR